MVSSRERSFIDQAVCYHASGGDIDAPVQIGLEESERVRIREIRRAHQGATRLWFAACHNWCSAIEWLLQHGANRSGHAQDFTPLHIASSYDHCDATVLLLDAGASRPKEPPVNQISQFFMRNTYQSIVGKGPGPEGSKP